MLVLDVLHDRVPAPVVVDQVAIAGGVNNVQPQTDTVLFNNMRHGMNLGRGSDNFVGLQSAFGLHKVGSEDGVDQRRLAQASLTCKFKQDTSVILLAAMFLSLRQVPRLCRGKLSLTDANNIELKPALQELALNLGGDAIETNMALRVDGSCRHGGHFTVDDRDPMKLAGQSSCVNSL